MAENISVRQEPGDWTPTTKEYMSGKAGARHPTLSQWMHVARTADTAVQWDEIEITEKLFLT